MADIKLTQLPIAHKLTEQLREHVKDAKLRDDAPTAAQIKVSTKRAINAFTGFKTEVDSTTHEITSPEVNTDTLDKAKAWGDRIARPYEVGHKLGLHAASAWDFAFSFLVGRGIKNQQGRYDLKSLSKEEPVRAQDRAHNYQAFRQEGVLGLLTRVPTALIASLVGMGLTRTGLATQEGADAVKEHINNGMVGFNAAVRTVALTGSTAAVVTTGVLVGLGVSALASVVAAPALKYISHQANKAKQAQANPEPAAPTAGSARGADKAKPQWNKLKAAQTSALEALNKLEKQANAPVLDKVGTKLQSELDAAVKAYTEAEKSPQNKASLKTAAADLTKAQAAFSAHAKKSSEADNVGAELRAAIAKAKNELKAAQEAGKTPVERAHLQADVSYVEEKSQAHEDSRAKAAVPAKINQKKALAAIKEVQAQIAKNASFIGSDALGVKSDPEAVLLKNQYGEFAKKVEELRTRGVLDVSEGGLDKFLENTENQNLDGAKEQAKPASDAIIALETALKNDATALQAKKDELPALKKTLSDATAARTDASDDAKSADITAAFDAAATALKAHETAIAKLSSNHSDAVKREIKNVQDVAGPFWRYTQAAAGVSVLRGTTPSSELHALQQTAVEQQARFATITTTA